MISSSLFTVQRIKPFTTKLWCNRVFKDGKRAYTAAVTWVFVLLWHMALFSRKISSACTIQTPNKHHYASCVSLWWFWYY